jgi:uncharacterized Tic20 family protein
MKIQEIRVEKKESIPAQFAIIILAVLEMILSFTVIVLLFTGGETQTIGMILGVGLILLAVLFALLKKGFIYPETVIGVE